MRVRQQQRQVQALQRLLAAVIERTAPCLGGSRAAFPVYRRQTLLRNGIGFLRGLRLLLHAGRGRPRPRQQAGRTAERRQQLFRTVLARHRAREMHQDLLLRVDQVLHQR
jgi:hypothetical protein